MKKLVYQLDITLHEATFFASHELDRLYSTEPLIGNYALAYAFGFVRSPYNRNHVGYAEDFPALNQNEIYVTPAWPIGKTRFTIEQFNCQAESFVSGMSNNAVIELIGREFLKDGLICSEDGSQKVRPRNRPQIGVVKMLSPLNAFRCHVISRDRLTFPRYVRIGKFMSKAKVSSRPLSCSDCERREAVYPLVNPIDLDSETDILFGDTINIHPTPLIKNARLKCRWYTDEAGAPVLPQNMKFGGV